MFKVQAFCIVLATHLHFIITLCSSLLSSKETDMKKRERERDGQNSNHPFDFSTSVAQRVPLSWTKCHHVTCQMNGLYLTPN